MDNFNSLDYGTSIVDHYYRAIFTSILVLIDGCTKLETNNEFIFRIWTLLPEWGSNLSNLRNHSVEKQTWRKGVRWIEIRTSKEYKLNVYFGCWFNVNMVTSAVYFRGGTSSEDLAINEFIRRLGFFLTMSSFLGENCAFFAGRFALCEFLALLCCMRSVLALGWRRNNGIAWLHTFFHVC